jgi:hypothetical protein
MKTFRFKIVMALGLLTLLLPGCLDIRITTTVRPDGSIGQTVVFKGDSAEIADVQFPMMKELGWTREWSKPEKDKYQLTMSKDFASVKELNASMNPADTSRRVVRVNATLHKRFRWFFTRYEFSETVLNANPFRSLDYHQYLSDEEIRLIALSEDDRKSDPQYDSVKYKDTEKRFEEYLYHCIFEDFYETLEATLSHDQSFTLTPQELDDRKDQLYRYLVDSTSGDTPDAILESIGKVIESPDIQTIRTKYIHRFDDFTKKMDFHNAASDDSYKFAIRMPGLLLLTNSTKIEGSTSSWELTYYDFFFHDYTMSAESRTVNNWAFVVAGLILLLALSGLVISIWKRR